MIAAGGLGAALALGAAPARPAWLVVANDETIVYVGGKAQPRPDPGTGSLALPRITGESVEARSIAGVPVSYVGPPTSVAVRPGGDLALVTCPMSPGVERPPHLAPDRRATLVRLDADGGAVVGTVAVGPQPAGTSFFPDGRRAWIANRGDSTVSVLTFTENSARETARIPVGEPDDLLSHVEISPDGRCALATLNQADAVLLLEPDAGGLPRVVERIATGRGPYAVRFLPGGLEAVVAHIGTNEVVFLSLRDSTPVIQQRVPVGRVPEGIDVSPDGEWVAASCMEGFGLTDPTHPRFGQPGSVYLLHRTATGFAVADRLPVAGGPQFALFSPDSRYLVVADTGHRRLAVFRREGDRFLPTPDTVALPGEPVAAARRP